MWSVNALVKIVLVNPGLLTNYCLSTHGDPFSALWPDDPDTSEHRPEFSRMISFVQWSDRWLNKTLLHSSHICNDRELGTISNTGLYGLHSAKQNILKKTNPKTKKTHDVCVVIFEAQRVSATTILQLVLVRNYNT